MSIFKSDLITDMDARPPVFSSPGLVRGQGRKTKAVSDLSAALVTNDIVQLCRIKSDDIVSAINFKNDDLDSGATGTSDLGLYDKDGVVVDVDVYGAALTFLRGALTDWTNQDLARTVARQNEKVWETLGLTTDPKVEYILALTIQANFDQTGDIAVELEFNGLNS